MPVECMGNNYKVMRFRSFVLFMIYVIRMNSKMSLSITGDRWKYVDYNKVARQIENVLEMIHSAFFFNKAPVAFMGKNRIGVIL